MNVIRNKEKITQFLSNISAPMQLEMLDNFTKDQERSSDMRDMILEKDAKYNMVV